MVPGSRLHLPHERPTCPRAHFSKAFVEKKNLSGKKSSTAARPQADKGSGIKALWKGKRAAEEGTSSQTPHQNSEIETAHAGHAATAYRFKRPPVRSLKTMTSRSGLAATRERLVSRRRTNYISSSRPHPCFHSSGSQEIVKTSFQLVGACLTRMQSRIKEGLASVSEPTRPE